MIGLLVVLFILSGAAGLIYESIWSRYLGLFVGHTAYAQILVLIIFLGGMSLGALAVARRAERVRDPLLGYAIVEVLIGLLGLAFHPMFEALTETAYRSWFPATAGGFALPLLKWSLAAALILPQSVLLGATFPLMTAGALRRRPRAPGQMVALLYFANSFGAACGALASGFVLVAAFGLPGTVTCAAALNLIVAAGAWIVARRVPLPAGSRAEQAQAGASAAPEAAIDASPVPAPPSRRGPGRAQRTRSGGTPATIAPTTTLLLVVSFGTAVASFFYEIAWIRMLSLVLGSTSRSFEIMLSTFILGLALGALWVRSRADRLQDPVLTLAGLQWAMGVLAVATLPLYMASFGWMSDAVSTFARDDAGYQRFTWLRYAICLAVMLPATFCAGTTLPLLTRLLLRGPSGERAIGLVYGVNTLGSILGVGIAGLLLLPIVGLKGLLAVGAAVDIGLGIALLNHRGRTSAPIRRTALLATAVTAILLPTFLVAVPLDRLRLTSGVYRSGQFPDPATVEIEYYRDGRTATVSVERYNAAQSRTLSTNGKADASLRLLWSQPAEQRPPTLFVGDESTQALTALVTLAHHPQARTAAIVGQGSGMTTHTMLGSPYLERVTTIEIEPAVVEASWKFQPANRRAFADPRGRYVIDDAKSHFAATGERYDLLVSEPSNPWVSGVAGLFSTEFYARARETLTEDGVFGQWLHVYEHNDELALTVLAAIHQHFRFYELFMVSESDMFIVATNRAAGLEADWGVMRYPDIALDLRPLPPFTPDLLEAMRVGDRRLFAPLLDQGVRANSDFHPILETGAEKARFLDQTAAGFLAFHTDRFSLARLVSGRRVPPAASFVLPAPHILRLRDLAMSAALRSSTPLPLEAGAIDERLPAAIEGRNWIQRELAAAKPPADWLVWMREALRIEDDWHLGSTGGVDEGFHGLLRRHLDATAAPPEARAALAFTHDLAAWDLPAAARAAEPLVAEALRGVEWIPVDRLFDGAVATHLAIGDTAAARRVFVALEPRLRRDPRDLRTRILGAHLGYTR